MLNYLSGTASHKVTLLLTLSLFRMCAVEKGYFLLIVRQSLTDKEHNSAAFGGGTSETGELRGLRLRRKLQRHEQVFDLYSAYSSNPREGNPQVS